MNSNQLERERLVGVLNDRIRSGEELRQELAELFNESAKLVLTPATEDLRAAGKAALGDVVSWQRELKDVLARLEPAAQQAWDATSSLHAVVEAVASENQAALAWISNQTATEARELAAKLKEGLGATAAVLGEALKRFDAAFEVTEKKIAAAEASTAALVRESATTTLAKLSVVSTLLKEQSTEVLSTIAGSEMQIAKRLVTGDQALLDAVEALRVRTVEFAKDVERRLSALESAADARHSNMAKSSRIHFWILAGLIGCVAVLEILLRH